MSTEDETLRRQGLIGRYLISLRLLRGMTQGELASAMGMSLRQYNRWETGGGDVQLKDDAFVGAMIALDGDFEHIRYLRDLRNDVDAQAADNLAAIRVHAGTSERPQQSELGALLEVIESERPELLGPLRSMLKGLVDVARPPSKTGRRKLGPQRGG